MIYENFEQKAILGLGFSEKHQFAANIFWQATKQGSHFLIVIRFYMQVLILSKSSQSL